jgi:hypothetical protein
MIPWCVIQSEGQICLFIKHWRTNCIISKTLRIATAWCQWQSGLSTSFIFDIDTPLPHLEARWFKSLREGLGKSSFKMHLHKTYVLPPERSNDVYLMEWAVLHSELSTKGAILILNYCRLYLHVTTISELFNAAGTDILPYMYECKRPPWFNPNQYLPIQLRPSSTKKKIWKPFCDCWKTKVSSQTHSFGIWTARTAHFRPHQSTYTNNNLTSPTLYQRYRGKYWTLAQKPEALDATHPNITSWILHCPTQWRPTSTSYPIF